VKGPNPKISFTLGPAPQADVTAPAEEETDTQTDVFVDPPADTVPLHEASGAPQTTYADDDGFDREAW
jgi:hypothetical protein